MRLLIVGGHGLSTAFISRILAEALLSNSRPVRISVLDVPGGHEELHIRGIPHVDILDVLIRERAELPAVETISLPPLEELICKDEFLLDDRWREPMISDKSRWKRERQVSVRIRAMHKQRQTKIPRR